MLALRAAPPAFGVADAGRIAAEQYGLSAEFQPLPGERDSNFAGVTGDGRRVVMKIFDDAASADAHCQTQVLRHLHEQDPSLPVPRLLPDRRGGDLSSIERKGARFCACLLSFLPGRPLAALGPPGAALLHDIGATLARLDRALRGFFHPALGKKIAWDVRRVPELCLHAAYLPAAGTRAHVEEVGAALRARGRSLRALRSQAIHGDCHGGNVLVDEAGAAIGGILDFGDMVHAPLILEPAIAMAELLSDGTIPLEGGRWRDELAQLLGGYGDAAGNPALHAADVEALYDLLTGRLAATLLVHAWRSRHDAAGAQLLGPGASTAARVLGELREAGPAALTREWHAAAGTTTAPTTLVDLGRRRALLGAGAELFYEQPLQFVRGEGVWLYDAQGRAYLDVYNNVPHVGHAHPEVVRAISRQARRLATHTRYLHPAILEYAERLTALCPPQLDACIFVNSGSEANDVAWRLAQHATGHAGAVVMDDAYHGITAAIAPLTPLPGQPKEPHIATLPHPPAALNLDSAMDGAQVAEVSRGVDAALDGMRRAGFEPAAFFLDTALTSSGIFDPPPAWLEAIAARVRAAGGLVIADEVQYGLGRPGSHFWGFERRGLACPDIVTLGKPVGNGYPMGVVIASRSLIESFQARFGFFSTFGGNPVAAAAGLAVLRVIERAQLRDNARETGGYLRARLRRLVADHACFGAVRGAGLLLGVEVTAGPGEPAAAASQAAVRTKTLVNALAADARILIGSESAQRNVLKLRPPLPFEPRHADLLVAALEAAALKLP